MTVRCAWEHNGNDTLLYAVDYPGAFTRGANKEEAAKKMKREICSFLQWCKKTVPEAVVVEIVQEKISDLSICDADSDIIFDEERTTMTMDEYRELKMLALKSAECFQTLFDAIPDKNVSHIAPRKTFYGNVPRTAAEMYEHTRNVNAYYFGEIGLVADNEGLITDCRLRGFETLERYPNFLDLPIFDGSYGEEWSLRKVLRRFLWHDRIHAKAMYRMSLKMFGKDSVPNTFCFDL